MSKKSDSLPILVILIGFAFALRVYRLDASPLRGDEAFAVRYWAAPPAEVLNGLAWVEPHPFGTLFGFWVWKSLVGSSEFAMRMLPTLINLLGVPAIYALGRRLFRNPLVGYIAAFLWAINPNLIWHSQDVRNYAIWAGLSAVSMWLLLRAADRSRRIDWALYVLVEAITLYVFFLEAFIVAVQALYILLFRRRALRPWVASVGAIGVLLIPWFGQAWALAHSGYGGAAAGADLGRLFSQFWQALVFGEWVISGTGSGFGLLLALSSFALFALCLFLLTLACRRAGLFLTLWLAVPAILLTLSAGRVNVFLPRYLIAVTPAILLSIAWITTKLVDQALGFGDLKTPVYDAVGEPRKARSNRSHFPFPPCGGRGQGMGGKLANSTVYAMIRAVDGAAVLLCLLILSGNPGDHVKAPDWYSLRDYLHANTTAADTVIMTSLDAQTGNADPAFEYYYTGPAQIITLPHPGFDIESVVSKTLSGGRAVWFVVSGSETKPINDALLANGVLISDQAAGRSFLVRQYRNQSVRIEREVDSRLNLSISDAPLLGYSITGMPHSGSAITVLMFWERLPEGLTAFVHLIGPAKPDGSPLWTQDDHPPRQPRDVYHLDLSSVPPGDYTIEIGLYDPTTNQRVPITDLATGKTLGDSYNLTTITITGK